MSTTRTHKEGARARKRKKGWRTAAESNIHDLYELSVQDPDNEVDIISQIWSEQRGRSCQSIREDFCGTAAVAIRWVAADTSHTAVGIDLDDEVLAFANTKASEQLDEQQLKRIDLRKGDVLSTASDTVDCLLAHNFSYFIFKQRAKVIEYFQTALGGLGDDGLFILDAYGGSDSFVEMEEERDMDGFTYVWDQHKYDPVTGDVVNYIHFRFPDGTRLDKAFTYEWRLWTIPEIREMLIEAGFSSVMVYWEGTDDETEEGNGEWKVVTQGEACEGWIAYVVGVK
ncbi:MAG: class I SAM-dependent methyltransferase [Phycisphaerae bacterium]|nr:class I SAM-dependent methyltransferase [Phycisphaerae bacterium]MBT5656987.1 class I SAM-dependent methyltransferase [Phycisphaerae bacterium]